MTIKVGDKLPDAKFRVMTGDGLQVRSTDEVFKGKKVALFAVPGAYTGTCHKMHLPSIFLNAYALKDKGVDTIAIVSVNDAFVMNAWKRDTDQRDEATFLADGNAEFTKAIGMELDASGNGLGIRSKRYSMLVDDGVVKKLNLEPAPGKVEVSGGETLRDLCVALGVTHLEVDGELEPGVPTSVMRGGSWDGQRLVSKSGAFGDSNFLVDLLEGIG